MRIKKDKNFMSFFDEKTGMYVRTGIIEDGIDTGVDPFMAEYPELLDVGIMGHCIHGENGLCIKAGIGCYQDGVHSTKRNMSIIDFQSIVEQCRGKTFQIALGGCGDPDQHEDFETILKLCKESDIVPNFTTSGYGMTENLAGICKKYCGAVAVSWYRSEYTDKAISLLLDAGVKTNIHYVLSNSTIDEAIYKLKESFKKSVKGFPKGINAVVFLLHKPIGLGKTNEVLQTNDDRIWELLRYIDEKEFPFKIGFDSCTVPALIQMNSIDIKSLDTCEGGRWSAYISADMKMMPCSFDNQSEHWAVDLNKNTIVDAWNSEEFDDFRNHFCKNCRKCKKRNICFGGCPIVPEIVLCKQRDFLNN